MIESASPRLCERSAASTSEPQIAVRDLLRARDLARSYAVSMRCSTRATRRTVVGADEDDVDELLLRGELLQLRERDVDVDALAAERRATSRRRGTSSR